MIALIWFVLAVLASPFKSKSRLEAENAVLRHQLIVLRRVQALLTVKSRSEIPRLTVAGVGLQHGRKDRGAYFRKINADGGINGRNINFISYDDSYLLPKTVEQSRCT